MSDVLSVRDLRVDLGGRRVLDGVNIDVSSGEVTGLIGSNGAGKTTLMKVVLGLARPAGGTVEVERPVGYVPQRLNLDPDLPLRSRDMVALGVDGHRFGLTGRARSAERAGRVEEALDAVGAAAFADAPVGRLSGGEQQRVMIAHALAGRPRLLLLDEPLANLDLRSANEVVSVLAGVAERTGVGVLLSAHDVNPLLAVMRSVAYMAGGRVVCGPTAEVIQTGVLSALYRHPVDVVRVGERVVVMAE